MDILLSVVPFPPGPKLLHTYYSPYLAPSQCYATSQGCSLCIIQNSREAPAHSSIGQTEGERWGVYGGPHAALALLWMELQGLDVGCNAESIGWVGW